MSGHGRNPSFLAIFAQTENPRSEKTTSAIALTARSSEWTQQSPSRSMSNFSVMHALLTVTPFSALPLHVRCFTEHAFSLAHSCFDVNRQSVRVPQVLLDLGGVSGSTGQRRQSTTGVTSREGPIDVSDGDFRLRHWAKRKQLSEAPIACGLCPDAVDHTVSESALNQS